MKATKAASGAPGDLAHDLIMRAVAEALAKKKNVKQEELLNQIPGMPKAALNSTIERMKKRLRSARRRTKPRCRRWQLYIARGDHAANLLLGVAKSSPPSVVDDSKTNEPPAQNNNTGEVLEIPVPAQSDTEPARAAARIEDLTSLQDELRKTKHTKSAIDAENVKLGIENARLETQLQVTKHLADTEEKVRTLETQVQKEKTTVESQRAELDKLRHEHEKTKTSVTCSTTPQTTPDSLTDEKHVLERRLEDALQEKSALERKIVDTTRTLEEAHQECLQLRSQLTLLENSQKPLRLTKACLKGASNRRVSS